MFMRNFTSSSINNYNNINNNNFPAGSIAQTADALTAPALLNISAARLLQASSR